MIDIKLLDMTDNWEQDASLPEDVPLRKVLVDLLRQLGLPESDKHGDKIGYALAIDGQDYMLDPDRTLVANNVRVGSRLRLLAAFTVR